MSADVEEPQDDDDAALVKRWQEQLEAMTPEERAAFEARMVEIRERMGEQARRVIGDSGIADIGRVLAGKVPDFSSIVGKMKLPSLLDQPQRDALRDQVAELHTAALEFEVDDSPSRTAEGVEQMAAYMQSMLAALQQSVKLAEETRREAEATRLDNESMAKFNRKATYLTASVAVLALVAAVIAIFV